MSPSLFDLLSRQTPTLQVRKGLIVLDLQNDFVSPSGKLPVGDTGFLGPLSELVRSFREFGDVIWVRTQFESTRSINGTDAGGDNVVAGGSSGKEIEMQSTDDVESDDVESDDVESDDVESSQRRSKVRPAAATPGLFTPGASKKSGYTTTPPPNNGEESDEELFLTRTSKREPCCLRGTAGAEYAATVLPMIQQTNDLQMIKTHYSAFSSTSLLLTLRGKLITELYICGCLTNLSVYATAMDAARYGIKVTLVDDCLGYRRQAKHDLAVAQLHEFMEASTVTSAQLIKLLRGPSTEAHFHPVVSDNTAPKHNEITSLEADSDDSDEEDEEVKPTPSRLFDRRVDARLARTSTRYSPHVLAARGREAASGHARPPGSHADNASKAAAASPKTELGHNGQRVNAVAPSDLDCSGGDSSKLSSYNSSYNKAWLDLLPSTPSSLVSQSKHPVFAAMNPAAAPSPSSVTEIEVKMQCAEMDDAQTRVGALIGRPLFGNDNEEASAGSRILHDILPRELADVVFDKLNDEVDWQKMYHLVGEVPRLVCCQGSLSDDGSGPIYRHPSDHTIPLQKWTKTVDVVRKAAEQAAGHSLNHALIQLYRSGTDFISEHSDKTLDIVPGSNIVNVSFGAQRTMRLRTKRGALSSKPNAARATYRVPTPHNSMIIMSLKTNAQYLHGINADKRPRCELVESEIAYGGQRISCTFRQIGTFISKDSHLIWGQGAVGKTRQEAREVINGDASESEKMVRAFGAENAASTIEWQQIYGQGFDVLHLKAIQQVSPAPADTANALHY